MDTKSKNINEENVVTDSKIRKSKFDSDESYEEMVKDFKKMKLARTVAMILLAMAMALSIISAKDLTINSNIFRDGSIYSRSFLGDDIDEFTNKVLTFGELYKSEEYIKDPNNITSEELNIAKNWATNQIESEYEEENSKLYDQDTSGWSDQRWEKEQENIRTEIEKKHGYDDEGLKNLIIEQKLINYTKYKNTLDSQENLKYILYDKSNNIWLSNYSDNGKDDISRLKDESGYFAEHHISSNSKQSSIYVEGMKLSQKELDKYNIYSYNDRYYGDTFTIRASMENDYYGNYSESIDVNSDLDIYISVPSSLVFGDSIYTGMEDFVKYQRMVALQVWTLIGEVVGVIVLLIILKKMKYKGSYLDDVVNRLREYPVEFNLIGLLICYFIRSVLYRYNCGNSYRDTLYFRNVFLWTGVLIATYLVVKAVCLKYKEGDLLKNSYLIQFYENVKISLEKKSFGKKLFSILAIYVVGLSVGGFMLIATFNSAGAVIAIVAFVIATVVALFTTVRDFAYLNKITKGAKDICEGRTSQDIPERRKGALRDLAHSINNMKEGLRNSIENETKSEKMKTELITNVSHDLKTPLTSIINYVDLLKRAQIEPEEARTYVEVLDKKSQRLKVLIDDLFEASKAASGAMQLTFTRVEVMALLRQTLGEAEGRIENANLDFKIGAPKEKIYISADGRKIWRVFENLISNIIKYSLPGTRVYITVREEGGKVYITMKNISSYELNFDPEEITERFKRGEESRYTEGSGLGLAIAKSIVELHGGEFGIEIDGDLFKSTVIFNIDMEESKK